MNNKDREMQKRGSYASALEMLSRYNQGGRESELIDYERYGAESRQEIDSMMRNYFEGKGSGIGDITEFIGEEREYALEDEMDRLEGEGWSSDRIDKRISRMKSGKRQIPGMPIESIDDSWGRISPYVKEEYLKQSPVINEELKRSGVIKKGNKSGTAASKGRFGDSELRKVDGEVSHVNPIEANLIDSLGKNGEEIVKEIGSGTINPETGLDEYFFKKLRRSKAGKWWNRNIGKYGAGGWLSGGAAEKADALRGQAGGVVSGGLADLHLYGESYLEGGGILEQEKDSKISALGGTSRDQLGEIDNYADQVAMKGNMATGVDLTTNLEKGLIDNYNRSLGDINLESQKTQMDFIADLKKQKTQLLMDYSTATGDAYAGSADSGFDDFIDQYS
tara:strand:- start:2122 stop:3297 length:1176 start_codon:yes stop_codon:yes gene_type:complete